MWAISFLIFPVAKQSFNTMQESEEALGFSFSNISLIRERFAQLQVLIYRKIEARLHVKEISLVEVRLYIRALFSPGDCIPKEADVSDIFTAMTVNRLCDFVNYQPLLRIAKTFGGGDKEMEEKCTRYIEELKGYKMATTMERYISLASALSDEDLLLPSIPARKDERYLQQLTLKLGLQISATSLMYIDELWDALANFFLLPPVTVILDRIIEGSVIITWLVPLFVVPLLMEKVQLKVAESTKFFRNNNIESVMIDSVHIYQESQVSEQQQINQWYAKLTGHACR